MFDDSRMIFRLALQVVAFSQTMSKCCHSASIGILMGNAAIKVLLFPQLHNTYVHWRFGSPESVPIFPEDLMDFLCHISALIIAGVRKPTNVKLLASFVIGIHQRPRP